jgi:hypothetical protein
MLGHMVKKSISDILLEIQAVTAQRVQAIIDQDTVSPDRVGDMILSRNCLSFAPFQNHCCYLSPLIRSCWYYTVVVNNVGSHDQKNH